MKDFTKQERAAQAQALVRQYMERVDAYCESDFETASLDLIADILHAVDANNGDSAWVHRMAYDHFLEETA